MELGIQRIKDWYRDNPFKWFERKEVRDETNLSPEEVKYIRGWSISPLGFGYIFYVTKRFLPDILTVYVITYLYFEVEERFISPVVTPESIGQGLYLLYALITLPLLLASVYSFYFTFRHGRRLSWNRGRYTTFFSMHPKRELFRSVNELKDSEKRYIKYGVIPSLTVTVLALAAIFFLT